MKLLVDEMPVFPDDDCMFCEHEWDYEEENWVNYCKPTNKRCDLDSDRKECSCLKSISKLI